MLRIVTASIPIVSRVTEDKSTLEIRSESSRFEADTRPGPAGVSLLAKSNVFVSDASGKMHDTSGQR